MARYGSDIEFLYPECGERVGDRIAVPETYWSGDDADERFVEDDAFVECSECDAGFDLHVQNSDGAIAVMIHGHEDVTVDASHAFMTEPDEPDYDDLDVPPDPASNLIQTLVEVQQVLKLASTGFYTPTVSRMAFIQQFAGFEAYLSDTLIGQIVGKPAVLKRALTAIDELRDMKLPLVAVSEDPDIVKRTVAAHLRDLMYHNFTKIGSIWHATLGFHMFPDRDVRARMHKAVPIRHDCVHRNGKDKEGNERLEVTDSFVGQVDADMRAVVRHVETILSTIA